MTTFFYRDAESGVEYRTAEELFAFLTAGEWRGQWYEIDAWRDQMYELARTPLAWGELRTAREIYDMILSVYALAHRADGKEPLI